MKVRRTRNGFIYSLFALLMMGLALNLTLLPLAVEDPSGTGEKLRVDEVFYFLQSVESDFDRATDIIGRRSMTAMGNRIVNNGSYLDDSQEAFSEAFINGTINGTLAPLMNRSSFSDWSESMEEQAEDSGYNLTASIESIEVGSEPPVTALINATYQFNLSDDITDTRFERTKNVSQEISFEGVEDSIILIESAGRYTNFFSSCRTDTPAEQLSTGGNWFYQEIRNWTSGNAVLRPGNSPVTDIDNTGEKVAVVDDLCSYSDLTDLSGFAGVVSGSNAIDAKRPNNGIDACGEDDVNLEAVVDDSPGALSAGNDSMIVMTEDEVWQNNLRDRTEEGCYFSDPWAPTVWERMEGRLSNSGGEGTAFLLTVPDLPNELQEDSKSAVAYVYFNDSSDFGETSRIKGVTNEDLDWFRLDQQHVDEWGINALTYE
ncbi:MAG: hypothetical protein MUP63_00155 [Candidatus Nanohaloarchaeota archaeon QJJ-7]|nr:hypothetical protein [Candidatus Nanohaloarchaeota archaeon QJJ-7]